MPVPRPLPVFLSVLFAVGLWVYGAVGLRPAAGTRGGYATLVCGDSYSDREIRDRLDGRGLTGLVSESDQWALLDCFGYIEKIPLVEYGERLLPFDPRNDGYAEKLRSLFVRDGKRFVYIQIGANAPENLEMQIAGALSGIPYSLEYAKSPPGRDILFPLIAFCLTACAFIVIPVLRRQLNAVLLPCLLALSPLAFGAAPGFALFSLLAGFAALLAEPGKRAKWLLAAALIVCYVFFSFFSGLPVLFAFFVLASFCCVLAVSVKGRYPRRRRFTPVEIIRRPPPSSGFFRVMLPFAVMATVFAFAGFAKPQPSSSHMANVTPQFAAPQLAGAITEADFKEHYLFQSAFSFRTLGKTYEAGAPPVIAGYKLSSNGLLEPAAPVIDDEIQIPDFPLGDLLRGLNSAPRAADAGNSANSAPVALLLSLPPIIFIVPAFIYSIKKKRQVKNRMGFIGFSRWTC